jgi:hypothetical protein
MKAEQVGMLAPLSSDIRLQVENVLTVSMLHAALFED